MQSPAFAIKRTGLSLVEVLVVLGILTALISLLVPGVRMARRHAHAAACMSNLRQWGQSAIAYAADNNGFLPRRGQGIQATNQLTRREDWFNALPPVLQMQSYMELAAAGQIHRPGRNSSIWICPAAVDPGTTNYFSYGMNMGLSVWESNINGGKPDNITAVGNTALLVFMADGLGDHCSVFPSSTPGGYNPAARHGSSVNICFMDGHVAAYSGSYIGVGTGLIERADVRWHPPNNKWNSAR